MPLPKIDVPLFELEMPSTGKKVTCRPFLVKEEKILLMAQQADDDKERMIAIKQILTNCIQDKNFDADKLTTFDVDYMFVKLRARSVDNMVSLVYRDYEDNKEYKFDVDLNDVKIEKPDTHNSKIEINKDIGLIMRYPTVTMVESIRDDSTPEELAEALLFGCLDKVYDNENIYAVDEEPREEVEAFVNSLSVEVYNKIREFFNTMPKMKYVITYKNSMGTDRRIELSTLRDFFMWG